MKTLSKKHALVVEYILQGLSTEQIAKKMGYSIGWIRNIYTELREHYNVNDKMGIVLSFINEELKNAKKSVDKITSIIEKSTLLGKINQMIPPKKVDNNAPLR